MEKNHEVPWCIQDKLRQLSEVQGSDNVEDLIHNNY
jgi:hypothetical protein